MPHVYFQLAMPVQYSREGQAQNMHSNFIMPAPSWKSECGGYLRVFRDGIIRIVYGLGGIPGCRIKSTSSFSNAEKTVFVSYSGPSMNFPVPRWSPMSEH